MSARAVRLALLTVLGSLLLAAPAAALEVEEDYTPDHHRFVTVHHQGHRAALVLTAATTKHYAGHWLDWQCTKFGTGDGLLRFDGGESGDTVVRRKTDPVALSRGDDYCQVQLTVREVHRVRGKHATTTITTTHRLRQTVAVSDAGRRYVERVRGAQRLLTASLVATLSYHDAGKTYLSASQIVAKYPLPGLVALSSRDAAPGRGKVGLWTDGAQIGRVTYGLSDGTQLFSERDLASGVLTTNADAVIGELTSEDGWWSDALSESERTRGG